MVKFTGKVYTPKNIADKIVKLTDPDINDIILEPSVGTGVFIFSILKYIQKKYSLNLKELKKYFSNNIYYQDIDTKTLNSLNLKLKNYFKDNNLQTNSLNNNFILKSFNLQFDIIIGNPPYVKYLNLDEITKNKIKELKIFNNNSNLYMVFTYLSILKLKEKGKLSFLIPFDFLKATSSLKFNNFIFKNGTVTYIEYLKENIFENAKISTIIFIFEKSNFTHITKLNNKLKKMIINNGYLYFLDNNYNIQFSDIFYVKVGGVSGLDSCFEHKDGIEFVCSYTRKTGKTKKMLYNTFHPSLLKFKELLLKRKIAKFNEKNWFNWGRNFFESNDKRIYVNCKTRTDKPFFVSDIKAYDGSVLAIFPKNKKIDVNILCEELNKVNWKELGFKINGRYIFSQKSLENSILPDNFKKYIN